jgi:hypothetical protein
VNRSGEVQDRKKNRDRKVLQVLVLRPEGRELRRPGVLPETTRSLPVN